MSRNAAVLTIMGMIFGASILVGGVIATSQYIIISEIMQNPYSVSDTNGEWVELYNPLSEVINLKGLIIKDDDLDSHVISEDVFISPGQYAVLCRNGAPNENGGVACDYDYTGFVLSNGVDEVILMDGEIVLDAVRYDDGATFPDPTGASMNLDPDAFDALSNDDGSNWCEATSEFGVGGDFGTPGSANDFCGESTTTSTTSTTTTTVPSTTTSTTSTTTTTQSLPPEEIPEYPTAAIPALISAGGYFVIRRFRSK